MDPELSILVSSQGYTEIDWSLGFSRMVFFIMLAYLFRFQFNIHLLIVLNSGSIFASSATFSGLIM